MEEHALEGKEEKKKPCAIGAQLSVHESVCQQFMLCKIQQCFPVPIIARIINR